MTLFRKDAKLLKLFTIVLVLSFTSTGFSLNASTGRIIPTDRVMMLENGKSIGSLTSEAPFPEGAMLSCRGRCAAKFPNLYVVAEDGSLFRITSSAYEQQFQAEEGTFYFALSKLNGVLRFMTPQGIATVEQLLVQASGNSDVVKGFVALKSGKTEIGVIDGGTMVVSTAEGQQQITPGRQITLAQADLVAPGGTEPAASPPPPAPTPPAAGGVSVTTGAVVGGLLLVGGLALAAGGGGGGGGGAPSSPAVP